MAHKSILENITMKHYSIWSDPVITAEVNELLKADGEQVISANITSKFLQKAGNYETI